LATHYHQLLLKAWSNKNINFDGEITRDEFVTNAMKCGFIQNLLDEKVDIEDEMQMEDNVEEEEEECKDGRKNEVDEMDE
jgi:hypothetical protein